MKSASGIWALAPCVALSGLLTFAGCGGGERGVVVQGRILNDGQPYKFLEEKEELQVVFVSGEGEELNSYPATVQPDGTFSVPGPDSRGIPPGNYRILVESVPYGGDLPTVDEEKEESQGDKFRGRFSAERTKLRAEVPGKTSQITIDLKKETVTQ